MPGFGVTSSPIVTLPPGAAVTAAGEAAMVACADPGPRNCRLGDACVKARRRMKKRITVIVVGAGGWGLGAGANEPAPPPPAPSPPRLFINCLPQRAAPPPHFRAGERPLFSPADNPQAGAGRPR